MADPRFYHPRGPFTLREIAEATGATLHEAADPSYRLRDVAPLDRAGTEELSFLDNKLYLARFAVSKAGAAIVHPDHAARAPAGMALLLAEEPYKAYARAAQAFYPLPRVTRPGVSPDAHIDEGATLGPGCQVEPGVVVERGVEIGANCYIGPNVVIGENVVVGADCFIGAGASLSHCLVGARVTIHPGARIGQAGFGFAPDPGGHVKVPQVGRVVLHDDVRVGANTTIDRGAAADTIIGPGCMIDNLVQIGHNVQLGRGCVIVAQVGLSGSTRLEEYVVLGGQVGAAGHLTLGTGAQVAAKSGITRDLPGGQTYGGIPAVPIQQWRRQVATVARLVKGKRKSRN